MINETKEMNKTVSVHRFREILFKKNHSFQITLNLLLMSHAKTILYIDILKVQQENINKRPYL